jgi:hypothetical protein
MIYLMLIVTERIKSQKFGQKFTLKMTKYGKVQ